MVGIRVHKKDKSQHLIFLVIIGAILVYFLFFKKDKPTPVTGSPAPAQVTVAPAPSPPESFEQPSNKHFVLLYSPGCGHCHKMMPDWDKLMAKFKDHPKIKIYKIDCASSREGQEVASKEQVEGFPTMKYFEHGLGNGDGMEFFDRSYDGLESFVNSKL